MLESVRAIHALRVVHADLKPANFVLVKGHLKVIDFGLAGEVAEGEEYLLRDFVGGTRDYMSPESLECYIIENGALNIELMRERKVRVNIFKLANGSEGNARACSKCKI